MFLTPQGSRQDALKSNSLVLDNMHITTLTRKAYHLCSQNDEFSTRPFLKLHHFLEGEVTADVCVHDKQEVWIATVDLVTEVVHAAPCTQGSVLLQVATHTWRASRLTHEGLQYTGQQSTTWSSFASWFQLHTQRLVLSNQPMIQIHVIGYFNHIVLKSYCIL